VANPLVLAAGTTTLSLSHSIKVSKITVVATSATAATLTLSDLNGNLFTPPIIVPGTPTPGNQVTADFSTPVIIPGGTNLSSTNCIATLTGAGGAAYLYHR